MERSRPRLPAIISDKDGVIKKGSHEIPHADETLSILRTPIGKLFPEKFKDLNLNFPFYILTNGGTIPENQDIIKINKRHKLTGDKQLLEHNLICNFTPMKEKMREYADRLVLVTGNIPEELIELCFHCGLQKFITTEEFMVLYPQVFFLGSLTMFSETQEQQQVIKEKFFKRNPWLLKEYKEEEPFQVHAIFIPRMPINWDQDIQIMMDVLTTEDGHIAKQQPKSPPKSHIPIFSVNPDIMAPVTFRLPRLAHGAFIFALQNTYKQVWNKELHVTQYGKPFKVTYDYTRKLVEKMEKNIEISNFYMIGDNPNSDIKGGNQAGWTTILVKTGMFKGEGNSKENPAKYVVHDFKEAIELIFKLEELSGL